jgi:adenosylmethionine-8-amino-7-oxononanoate aminotransferase
MIYVLTLLQPTLPTDVQIMRTDRDTAQLVEAAASESGYYTADARTYDGDHCLLLIPYAGTEENITAIVQNLNRIVNTYGKMLDADGSRITVPLEEDANA